MLAEKGNYTLASARTTWNNARRRLVAAHASSADTATHTPKVAARKTPKGAAPKASASRKRQRATDSEDSFVTRSVPTKKVKAKSEDDEGFKEEVKFFAEYCGFSTKDKSNPFVSDANDSNATDNSDVTDKADETTAKAKDIDEVEETDQEVDNETGDDEEVQDKVDEAEDDAGDEDI